MNAFAVPKGHDVMSLVTSVSHFLAPALINRMASSLGLGQGIVSKAMSAAVPGILLAVAATMEKSSGAAQLGRVLSRNDASTLRSFGTILGTSGQAPFMEGGSSALVALLGLPTTNALISAIGKFTGLNTIQSGSLTGLLAPVVLGHLSLAQKAAGLNADGLGKLLTGQAEAIAAALPPGFARLIDGIMPPLPTQAATPATSAGPVSRGAETPIEIENAATPIEVETMTQEPAPQPSITATLPPGGAAYPPAPEPMPMVSADLNLPPPAIAASIAATLPPVDVDVDVAPPAPRVFSREPLPPLPDPSAKASVPAAQMPITLSPPSVAGTLAPGAVAFAASATNAPKPFEAVMPRPDIAPSVAATMLASTPASVEPVAVAAPAVDTAMATDAADARPATPDRMRVDVAAAAAAASIAVERSRQAAMGEMTASQSPPPAATANGPAAALAASPSKPSISAAPPLAAPAKAPAAPPPLVQAQPQAQPHQPAAAAPTEQSVPPLPPSKTATTEAGMQTPPQTRVTPPETRLETLQSVPPIAQVESKPATPVQPAQPAGPPIPPLEKPATAVKSSPPIAEAKRKSDPWEGVPPPPSRALGVLKRLLVASIGGALLAAGLYGLAHRMPKPPASISAPAAPSASAAELVKNSITRLNKTLAGITDEPSAQAAITELQSVARDVRSVKAAIAGLSPNARRALSQVIKMELPGIIPAAEKVLNIGGANALISPLLSPIMADFDDLASA